MPQPGGSYDAAEKGTTVIKIRVNGGTKNPRKLLASTICV